MQWWDPCTDPQNLDQCRAGLHDRRVYTLGQSKSLPTREVSRSFHGRGNDTTATVAAWTAYFGGSMCRSTFCAVVQTRRGHRQVGPSCFGPRDSWPVWVACPSCRRSRRASGRQSRNGRIRPTELAQSIPSLVGLRRERGGGEEGWMDLSSMGLGGGWLGARPGTGVVWRTVADSCSAPPQPGPPTSSVINSRSLSCRSRLAVQNLHPTGATAVGWSIEWHIDSCTSLIGSDRYKEGLTCVDGFAHSPSTARRPKEAVF